MIVKYHGGFKDDCQMSWGSGKYNIFLRSFPLCLRVELELDMKNVAIYNL